MRVARRRIPQAAALALAAALLLPSLAGPAQAAVPPAVAESALPATLQFQQGGGADFTNISLDRTAHVREASLQLRGDPIRTSTALHLNASTVAASQANAWGGNLSFDTPDLSPEAYIASAFNATMIGNASLPDGSLAKTPVAPNFTYQLFVLQVQPAPVVELNILWSGYALPPSMPIFTSGRMFAYNFTALTWDLGASYPYPATGVQDVWFNTTHPQNFVKASTGSLAIMIVSESTQTEMFTDFFEVRVFEAVWPRPAVDVGNDGSTEWRFDAPGWGAMGRQTTFADGLDSHLVTFPDGGANLSTSFLVPAGMDPERASVVLRGVPNPGSAQRAGGPVTSGPSAALSVSGLPANGVGDDSFVRLVGLTTLNETTDSNRVAMSGTIVVGSDPSGYRAAAQTMNISSTGPFNSASVFVYRVEGNPGPLEIAIQSLNGTGVPTGPPLGSMQIPQALLANDTWVTFSFPGLLLPQGTTTSIVFRAPTAPPDTPTNYVTLAASNNNNFTDGEALSYFNVTSLGSTWSRPSGADLLFDLRQDLPTSSGEAALITLDSLSGSFSQIGSSSNLSFTIPQTPLYNGSHTFTISNSNPNPIRFNWTATVDYSLVPSSLSISVFNGNQSSWNFTNLTAGAELNLSAPLRAALLSPDIVAGPSPSMAQIGLLVSSSSSGAVEFSALDIQYSLDFTTGDLGNAFDTALWSTPAGPARADVPVRAYSPGPATLTIVEAAVTYDRAPIFAGFVSTVSPEDVELIADLNSAFQDDYDPLNLSFHFDVLSGSAIGFVALRGHNLSITPTENRSGDVVVNVTATDSWGLENFSGPITFSFAPVNDPPRLTTPLINVTWGRLDEVDLSAFIVDAESALGSLSIQSATGATVTALPHSLVFDLPENATDFDLNITLTDGAASATYRLHVHPRLSNTAPVLRAIPHVEVAANAAFRLDLGLYTSDAEDPLAALTFTLDLGPTAPVLWLIEGNATHTYLKLIPRAAAGTEVTATLTVLDLDGNANQTTLSIQIVAPPNAPPRIVGLDPTVDVGADTVSIFLVTKGTDPEEGALQWQVENLNPELFTAEVDPGTWTLTIHAAPGAHGVGTLVLTARDAQGGLDRQNLSVYVDNPQAGSPVSIFALGVFFAIVVLGAAVMVSRAKPGPPKPLQPHTALPPKAEVEEPTLENVEGARGDEKAELPPLPPESQESANAFLQGKTESPTDRPPSDDESIATLGLKSDPEGAAAALSAAPAMRPKAGPARLAELYLFSLKDGGLLYQAPPRGVAVLTQMDENEFLQWAYDAVRRHEKQPDTAKVLEWREWKVLLARGNSFFVAGRATGEEFDALRREVKTLVEEVDHNFPGTALDWQRTEMLESVTDILKRLVRGA